MNAVWTFLCIWFCGILSVAAFPWGDAQLAVFKADDSCIIYNAATNQSKGSIWVYKVVPQTFSVKALNYLLKLGDFTNNLLVSQGLSVCNKSNTCTINVILPQGRIKYSNLGAAANRWDKTNHLWQVVQDVPSQDKVEMLGLKFLKHFGITRKDLAQSKKGRLISYGETCTRGYYDRHTKTNIENEITARGIFFTRRVDGVNFTGIGLHGGAYIEFANHGCVSDFKLLWRNLERYECYRIKNSAEIIESIRNGEAVLLNREYVCTAEIKAISINDVVPLYAGADETQNQSFVYPFAKVEATAEFKQTNVALSFFCPILSTNKILSHTGSWF